MMKKTLAFCVALMLLFGFSSCAVGTEPPAGTPSTPVTESEPPASPKQTEISVDYAVFCGHYSDTDTVEGPCYTVSILSVDNASRTIEISISYAGINSSPIYVTDSIFAPIADDHTVSFEWTDSWSNEGIGTLILNLADPSEIQVMVTVTQEAEVNRATLSTHDQYKTLFRR